MIFPVFYQGKALLTPGKNPLAVPTRALADALAAASPSSNIVKLAYTAIDRIAGQEKNIIDTLLVYVDTDTLSYRAASSEQLAKLQQQQWQPILDWAKKTFGATWETTSGVMPLDQPKALHKALETYMKKLSAMQLSALCFLASGFSSLALGLAVLENHIDAAEAFRLSRLEEEAQAEQWGRDEEADQRAARLKEEVLTAGHFLRLLDAA